MNFDIMLNRNVGIILAIKFISQSSNKRIMIFTIIIIDVISNKYFIYKIKVIILLENACS